ncbi:MAG: glycosyl hydrolase family 18 protein, partial [Promethearchaeota archaeon]
EHHAERKEIQQEGSKNRDVPETQVESFMKKKMGRKILPIALYLGFISGFTALVFRIFIEYSWIDPNPIGIGAVRKITSRTYAPWDSIVIGVIICLYLLHVISWLKKSPRNIRIKGFIQLSIAALSWIIAWIIPWIPFFIASTIGVSMFLGGMIFLHHDLAKAIDNTLLNKKRPNLGWFLIAVIYTFSVVIGFVLFGVVHRNMWLIDYIPWIYAVIILVGALFEVMVGANIQKIKSKLGMLDNSVSNDSENGGLNQSKNTWSFFLKLFKRKTRDSQKKVLRAKPMTTVAIFVVIFCALYTAGISQSHGTITQDPKVVYMWGLPESGYFSEDWTDKITHVSLGGVSWNSETGVVNSITLNETLASYYKTRGIKVMPVIGLSGENLYHLIKNTDGRLDTFCSTLRSALENSTADGISVDFEMLETPSGETPPTDDDWLNLWKRIGKEVFHPESGKQYVFANYWGIGAGNSKQYVNEYMESVDLHIHNCYESHWHLGQQGATTIASSASGGVLEIYNLLNDKSLTSKIVLGLPLYGYRWVWGEAPTIPFRDEYKDNYTTTAERFEPYNVTMSYANESIIRWDPFSGGEWFEYKDELGRRCVGYTQGSEQLIQILNGINGYNIGGLMFWPGGNDPYPGLLDLL